MRLSQKSFILIENMLALAIIAFAITIFIQFFIIGSTQTKIASHRVSSINLIQDKVEQLKSLGYGGIIPSDFTPPQEEPVVIDIFRPDDPFDDLQGVRKTSVVDINNGKKIIVDITWAEFNRQFNESTVTVVFNLN